MQAHSKTVGYDDDVTLLQALHAHAAPDGTFMLTGADPEFTAAFLVRVHLTSAGKSDSRYRFNDRAMALLGLPSIQ